MSALMALAIRCCNPSFAQINGAGALGSGLGGGAFDATAGVLLKTMKNPRATVDFGPKRLDFSSVRLQRPVLNVLTITNGTNSRIEVESLLLPPSGFRIAGTLKLPLVIPPQTQAFLKVEFSPAESRDYSGAVEMVFRTAGGEKPHKIKITLKGKGVEE
ncbi:MAG: hypothetical protein WBE72_08875 [Terracidiphilus sp.]